MTILCQIDTFWHCDYWTSRDAFSVRKRSGYHANVYCIVVSGNIVSVHHTERFEGSCLRTAWRISKVLSDWLERRSNLWVSSTKFRELNQRRFALARYQSFSYFLLWLRDYTVASIVYFALRSHWKFVDSCGTRTRTMVCGSACGLKLGDFVAESSAVNFSKVLQNITSFRNGGSTIWAQCTKWALSISPPNSVSSGIQARNRRHLAIKNRCLRGCS